MEISISLSHLKKSFLITDAVLLKDNLKKILECKKCKRTFMLSADRRELNLGIGMNFKLTMELDHPNSCENIEIIQNVETVENETEYTNPSVKEIQEVRVVSVDTNEPENEVRRDISGEALIDLNDIPIMFFDEGLESEKIAAEKLFSEASSQWPSDSQHTEKPVTTDDLQIITNKPTEVNAPLIQQKSSSEPTETTETQQLLNEIKMIKDTVPADKIFQISFMPFYIFFIDVNYIKWINEFYKNTKSDINIYYICKPSSSLKTISGKPLSHQSFFLRVTINDSTSKVLELASSIEMEESFKGMQSHQYFLSMFKNTFLPITKCWPPFTGLIVLPFNIELISQFLEATFGKTLAEYMDLRHDNKIQPLITTCEEDLLKNLIKDINVFEVSEQLKLIVILLILQLRCGKNKSKLKDRMKILFELLLIPQCNSNMMLETQNVLKAENRECVLKMCQKLVEKSSTEFVGGFENLTETKLYQMIDEIEESIRNIDEDTENSQANEFHHPDLAKLLIKNYLSIVYIWDIEVQVCNIQMALSKFL